jgi:hypothetical protein
LFQWQSFIAPRTVFGAIRQIERSAFHGSAFMLCVATRHVKHSP